eukprot:g23258.t1
MLSNVGQIGGMRLHGKGMAPPSLTRRVLWRGPQQQRATCTAADRAPVEVWRERMLAAAPVTQKDFADPLRLHELALTLQRGHLDGDGRRYYRLHDGSLDPRVPGGETNSSIPVTPFRVPAGWQLSLFHTLLHEASEHLEPAMAADGFEKRWSPPPPYLRRMWAGANCTFQPHNPLLAGQCLEQATSVTEVTLKTGGSGHMVLVTERRQISNQQGVSVTEDRQLVYLQQTAHTASSSSFSSFSSSSSSSFSSSSSSSPSASAGFGQAGAAYAASSASPHVSASAQHVLQAPRRFLNPPAPPQQADFSWTVKPTPVMLFRYSTATFNAHLIHYNLPYCTQHEGYSDLLVHGPLTHTLLLEALQRFLDARGCDQSRCAVAAFSYRALAPLYVSDTITIRGQFKNSTQRRGQASAASSSGTGSLKQYDSVLLWAEDQRGSMAMRGTATLHHF